MTALANPAAEVRRPLLDDYRHQPQLIRLVEAARQKGVTLPRRIDESKVVFRLLYELLVSCS